MKQLIQVWSFGLLAIAAVLIVQKPAVQQIAVPAGLAVGTGALLVYGFKSGALN